MEFNDLLIKYDAYIVLITTGICYLIWHLLFRKRRSITYKINGISNIISSQHTEIEGIKIEFQNQSINYLDVWQMTFKNSGNIPVEKSQVKKPITITFYPGGLIQHVVEFQPDSNLEIDSNINNNNIEVNFELLNPNDQFKVIAYCIVESNVTVTAKMEGINTIKNTIEHDYFSYIISGGLILLALWATIRYIINHGTTLTINITLIGILILLFLFIRRVYRIKMNKDKNSASYGWRIRV